MLTYEVPTLSIAHMPHETKLLTAEQFLLTTLMVKLAVVAVLATMLVRFPWFRRILLTEKRDWPERLIFAASLGVPLTAGVVARLLLNYDAADLTLAGRVPRRAARRPVRRRDRRRRWSASRRLIAGEWIALPFAIGCGFAGGGLREICPKEAIWHFSPLFFTGPAPQRLAAGARVSRSTGSSSCWPRRSGSRSSAQALGHRFGTNARLFYLAPPNARGCARSSSSRRCCASRSRSRSGTARGSSTGCRSRKSC